MDDLIYIAIIGIVIGVFFLIQRFKYPTKKGDMKFSLNFRSLLIGIFCLGAGLIALVKYLISLFGCD